MDELTTKCAPGSDKSSDLISIEECKPYLAKYGLPDEQVLQLKNNLIGIVDSIINSYLDEFDQT